MPNLAAKGIKRVCTNCNNRFYDMNKRPVICPKCNSEWEIKSPTPATNDAVEDKKEEISNDALDGDNLVSLEDIEELEELENQVDDDKNI